LTTARDHFRPIVPGTNFLQHRIQLAKDVLATDLKKVYDKITEIVYGLSTIRVDTG
jgi:hypothetical protein